MSEKLTQADRINAQTYLVRNMVDMDLYQKHIQEKKELGDLIIQHIKSLAVKYDSPDIKELLDRYGLDIHWVKEVRIPGKASASASATSQSARGCILPDTYTPANYSRISFRSDQVKVEVRIWKIKLGMSVPLLDIWSDDHKYDTDGSDADFDGETKDENQGGILHVNNPGAVLGYGLVQQLKLVYESGLRVVLDKEAMSVALCAGMDSISTWEELEEFFPAGAAAAKAVRPMVVDPGEDPEIKATPSIVALERLRSLR